MIAATLDSWNGPLLDALAREMSGGAPAIACVPAADAAWQLLEQQVTMGLVHPLVAGRNTAELSLIERAGIFAVGPTGDSLLVFNPGLRDFSSIGVRALDDPDSILASVVLREKFDMSPVLRQYDGPIDDALRLCDAVLVTGSDAVARAEGRATIDIVDEWYDFTELPFPRAVAAAWNHLVTQPEADALVRAAATADRQSLDLLEGRMKDQALGDLMHLVPGHYRYTLDEDALEGMTEFLRLAFLHGLSRDIPTFKFWSELGEDASVS